MARLSINLSDELKSKLEARAAGAGKLSIEQYIETLIRSDAELPEFDGPPHLTFHNEQELEAMLLEGLNSGPGKEMNAADWAELRRKLVDRHSAPEES